MAIPFVYITNEKNKDKVAEFKKAHVGKGPEDPYYGSICFLDGTNQILSRGQIFGSTYKLLNSQEEYDNLKAEDKLDEYTLYLIKETEWCEVFINGIINKEDDRE